MPLRQQILDIKRLMSNRNKKVTIGLAQRISKEQMLLKCQLHSLSWNQSLPMMVCMALSKKCRRSQCRQTSKEADLILTSRPTFGANLLVRMFYRLNLSIQICKNRRIISNKIMDKLAWVKRLRTHQKVISIWLLKMNESLASKSGKFRSTTMTSLKNSGPERFQYFNEQWALPWRWPSQATYISSQYSRMNQCQLS